MWSFKTIHDFLHKLVFIRTKKSSFGTSDAAGDGICAYVLCRSFPLLAWHGRLKNKAPKGSKWHFCLGNDKAVTLFTRKYM